MQQQVEEACFDLIDIISQLMEQKKNLGPESLDMFHTSNIFFISDYCDKNNIEHWKNYINYYIYLWRKEQ